MPLEVDPSRELPLPCSDEINELFSNKETREAYRFLFDRRATPPSMSEWIAHAAAVLGKANVHTQRRLRDVRDFFVVPATRQPGGGTWTYQLLGWKVTPAEKATRISPTLEAEVYTRKGRFCAMCGKGPADGVKLQLDHITPRSWDGKTVFENLEPLCQPHNQGKRNYFASLDPYADSIRIARSQPDPWMRIGEALRALQAQGRRVPVELLEVVALETNKGDPLKRLRELRYILGWDYKVHRRKVDGITTVEYELLASKPWPPVGPRAAVTEYERERKRKKRRAQAEGAAA